MNYETAFPHETQNFQPASTSAPHAGQFSTCKFCPQWGQKFTGLPVSCGRSRPQ
jgi:hypothetical protein